MSNNTKKAQFVSTHNWGITPITVPQHDLEGGRLRTQDFPDGKRVRPKGTTRIGWQVFDKAIYKDGRSNGSVSETWVVVQFPNGRERWRLDALEIIRGE